MEIDDTGVDRQRGRVVRSPEQHPATAGETLLAAPHSQGQRLCLMLLAPGDVFPQIPGFAPVEFHEQGPIDPPGCGMAPVLVIRRRGKLRVVTSILPSDFNRIGARAAQLRPEQSIVGEKKAPHVLNKARCIKCGACYDVCRFQAIVIRSGEVQPAEVN